MSSSKTAEDQMGSGESDDEFSNVGNLNKSVGAGKDSSRKANSPKRTKIKYDYKFDSSSDDSDDTSPKKSSKSVKSPESNKTDGNGGKMKESKLPATISEAVEKTKEELKNVKTDNDKATADNAAAMVTSPKVVPPCVPSPVVVVPQPIIVSQTHSVMAMAPAGMIVPPAIGLANQNVMIPPPNILNLPGNVIRAPNPVGGIMAAAPGGAVVSMGNPSMISTIQNQGSVMGMTNDILQLQGNIMGLAAPGNMMPMPGICVAGNMIPVQGALQSNLMRIPGTNAAMANQAGIMGSAGTMMSPGGVMINTGGVMTVTNVVGNQGHIMGNSENMMLTMNNLGARINYPGNVLGAQAAQGMNNVGNGKEGNTSSEVHKQDSQTQISAREWRVRSKPHGKISLKKKKRVLKKSVARDITKKDDCGAEEEEEEEEEEEWEEEQGQEEDEEEEEDGDEEDAEDEDNKKPVVKEMTNTFKNDGSFMEMFKKMNEANSKASSNVNEKSSAERNESNLKKPTVIISGIVGKRRGGRVLKTGLVKKVKKDSENEEEKGPKDAWAVYMAEVKKYREASCEEEGKTRPLVK